MISLLFAFATIVQQATALQWGEVADSLQISVSTGRNTELLAEKGSLLYLSVALRNVSNAPVTVDFDQAEYEFEYEIDGRWYAFERMDRVRTPLSVMLSNPSYAAVSTGMHTVAPGSVGATILTVPLAGRSRSIQLLAIASGGLGTPWEPKAGAHVIRVRPGRALIGNRRAPVSNAVTVTLRIPPQVDARSQTVSFTTSRDTPLRELRFVSGPVDGQELIRRVLARPPNPSSAPRLITSAALDVLEPIPLYDLRLVRWTDEPISTTAEPRGTHYYLVRAANETVGFVGLDSHPSGSLLGSVGVDWTTSASPFNADALYDALQQVAQMEQVRGGNYEPRLVQVIGVRGALPPVVVWLHSSGKPDLYYRPRDVDARSSTKVESEKLYTSDELLVAAKTLPSPARYNAAWALSIATACAREFWGTRTDRNPLNYDQPVVESGVNGGSSREAERVGWYVYFPERNVLRIIRSHSGIIFFVDESNGACRLIPQG